MSRLDELERRVAELETQLGLDGIRPQPAMPYAPAWDPHCSCPPNTVCGNTACPRLINPLAMGH